MSKKFVTLMIHYHQKPNAAKEPKYGRSKKIDGDLLQRVVQNYRE
jgi:hypothetical protein